MAYKVLGQANPATTTWVDLYTVPAGKSAVCSSLVVANRTTSLATFRLAVRPAAAALADQHYVYYDQEVPSRQSFAATIGMSLAAGDVVSVYVSTQALSFSLFGDEA